MSSRLTIEVVAFQVIAFYPAPPAAEAPSVDVRDERAGGDSSDPTQPAAPAEDHDH